MQSPFRASRASRASEKIPADPGRSISPMTPPSAFFLSSHSSGSVSHSSTARLSNGAVDTLTTGLMTDAKKERYHRYGKDCPLSSRLNRSPRLRHHTRRARARVHTLMRACVRACVRARVRIRTRARCTKLIDSHSDVSPFPRRLNALARVWRACGARAQARRCARVGGQADTRAGRDRPAFGRPLPPPPPPLPPPFPPHLIIEISPVL